MQLPLIFTICFYVVTLHAQTRVSIQSGTLLVLNNHIHSELENSPVLSYKSISGIISEDERIIYNTIPIKPINVVQEQVRLVEAEINVLKVLINK